MLWWRGWWLIQCMTVSGGFAIVQPDSQLSINAVEGYALEDFSGEAVKSQISEASKIANGSGSQQDIAEAKIELEVNIQLKPLPQHKADESVGIGELASSHEIVSNKHIIYWNSLSRQHCRISEKALPPAS
jgi:hypothetical protein